MTNKLWMVGVMLVLLAGIAPASATTGTGMAPDDSKACTGRYVAEGTQGGYCIGIWEEDGEIHCIGVYVEAERLCVGVPLPLG